MKILNIAPLQTKRAPSRVWREYIRKVWEVDPLECLKCGVEKSLDQIL